jgi:hypothetical protein
MTSRPDTFSHNEFRKSSYSDNPQGNCVEIAGGLDVVRDSKNPSGPVLRADLTALLTAIKSDDLRS